MDPVAACSRARSARDRGTCETLRALITTARAIRRWLKQAGADGLDSRAHFRRLREGREA